MYVQINHKLLDDLSLIRCAKELGVSSNELIGALTRIWRFAMIHRTDGVLLDVTSGELAEIAMFSVDNDLTNGTSDFFLGALIKHNFISTEKKLAGWDKNSGEIFIRRENVRHRVSKHRKKEKEDVTQN